MNFKLNWLRELRAVTEERKLKKNMNLQDRSIKECNNILHHERLEYGSKQKAQSEHNSADLSRSIMQTAAADSSYSIKNY